MLLEMGAHVNTSDHSGETALFKVSVISGHGESAAEYLIIKVIEMSLKKWHPTENGSGLTKDMHAGDDSVCTGQHCCSSTARLG